jgi:hypothetical protein
MPVADPIDPEAEPDAVDNASGDVELFECRDTERRSPPSGVTWVAASTVVTARAVAVAVVVVAVVVVDGWERVYVRVGDRGEDAAATK